MKLGDRIAMLRKKANLTQEELADSLNFTRQSVSRRESNEVYPDMNKIGKLADILETNCDYLLKDDVNESGEKVKLVSDNNKVEKYINRLIVTILSYFPLIGFIVGLISIKNEAKVKDNLLRKLMIAGIIISIIVTIFMVIFVICAIIYSIR